MLITPLCEVCDAPTDGEQRCSWCWAQLGADWVGSCDTCGLPTDDETRCSTCTEDFGPERTQPDDRYNLCERCALPTSSYGASDLCEACVEQETVEICESCGFPTDVTAIFHGFEDLAVYNDPDDLDDLEELDDLTCTACIREATGPNGWSLTPRFDLVDHRLEFDVWEDAGFSLPEAKRWRAAGFEPEAGYGWVDSGFSPDEAVEWSCSFTSGEEAFEWFSAGFGPYAASLWTEQDVDTPDLAEEWTALGYGPEAVSQWTEWDADLSYVRANIAWPTEQPPDESLSEAMGLNSALAWSRSEFVSTFPQQNPLDWWRCNLSPAEAHQICSEYPEAVPRDAVQIGEAGLLLSSGNLKNWSGLDAEEILDAIDRGFPNTSSYEPFRNTSLDFDVIDRLRSDLGEIGVVEAINPAVVIGLLAAMVAGLDLDVSYPWIKAGFATDDITKWIASGLSPEAAAGWMLTKIPPSMVNAWMEAGFDQPTAAQAWSDAGLAPLLAADWCERGFTPSTATDWIKAGVEPLIAKRRAAAGMKPSSQS